MSLLDSNALGDELVGEYSDHGDLSALGHRVVEEGWRSSVCDCLSGVVRMSGTRLTLGSGDDDGSTLGNVGNSSSGQEESSVLPD